MLKNIILDKSDNCSSIMYMVIKQKYLDKIIDRIDKNTTKYNKLDSNKFINLFQKFIETFTDKFFYLYIAHFVIEEVIITNFSKIEEYSFEEIKDIFNLLSKLTFCRNGRNVFELFNNVDMRLKRYGSNRELSKRKKIQIDKYNDKILNRYIRQYDSIIKSYNSKKKYLKYFMEYK